MALTKAEYIEKAKKLGVEIDMENITVDAIKDLIVDAKKVREAEELKKIEEKQAQANITDTLTDEEKQKLADGAELIDNPEKDELVIAPEAELVVLPPVSSTPPMPPVEPPKVEIAPIDKTKPIVGTAMDGTKVKTKPLAQATMKRYVNRGSQSQPYKDSFDNLRLAGPGETIWNVFNPDPTNFKECN